MARGVCYIHRNGIVIYHPPLLNLLKIPFTTDSVRDLDVINEEPLFKSIQSNFTSNKIISPSSFIIVLANDTLFVKLFPSVPQVVNQPINSQPQQNAPQVPPQPKINKSITEEEKKKLHQEQESQIEIFIDHVPFESTSHKILNVDNGRQVIVANKALHMTLKNIFQKLGFTTEAVVPSLVFGKSVAMNMGFTPATAQAMLNHSDIIHQNDLEVNPFQQQPIVIGGKPGDPPPPKSRAYILIGIFVILLSVMIGMYYFTFMKPQPQVVRPKKKAVKVKITPTITITQKASNSAELSNLQIQIRSNPQSTLSAQLRTELTKLGISNVTVSSLTTTSSTTLVVFSKDITTQSREQILELIQKITQRVSTQESTTGSKNITVTFAR